MKRIPVASINPNGKVIGIVGSRVRNYTSDYKAVERAFLRIFTDGDWICSGGCPEGGDAFAWRLYKKYNTPYLEFPADWKRYGRRAGFIRNAHIATCSDVLIACLKQESVMHGGKKWGGTEDTINRFREKKSDKLVLII